MHSVWLVPIFTTNVGAAATHFQFAQTGGLPLSTITGRNCGSMCHINRGSSEDAQGRIIAIAFVRCPDHFLEMGKFREYDGILSHSGHSANDEESFHLLWKSAKISPG